MSTTACAPELPGELVRREAGQFRTLIETVVSVIGCNGAGKRILLKIPFVAVPSRRTYSDSVENMV